MLAVKWQRFEGGIVLLSCLTLYLTVTDALPWWAALTIFFVPDLSLVAYVFGPRAGAAVYNAAHLYALGMAVIALALVWENAVLLATGALWCAHVGFDRLLGFGLKSPEGFSFTHLGRIDRAAH